jgi:hypothetical protein
MALRPSGEMSFSGSRSSAVAISVSRVRYRRASHSATGSSTRSRSYSRRTQVVPSSSATDMTSGSPVSSSWPTTSTETAPDVRAPLANWV